MTNALVIMPTYNESLNLRHSVEELFKFNPNVSLLIVDDNSPDGTGELADELAKQFGETHVLHRTAKNGLGPAYLAGFKWAFERGFDRIVEMDADGSHRAEDLPMLLAEDADLVIGSRWVSGGRVLNWPFMRKAISRTGNLYTRVMLGTSVRDMTAGFRVYRRSLLEQLELEKISSHGYSFQVEMAWRSLQKKASVKEVAIVFVERELGSSKMNSAIVLEALWLVTKWGVARLFGRSV
jgi:dolichol-phosphate mannosyltransferase